MQAGKKGMIRSQNLLILKISKYILLLKVTPIFNYVHELHEIYGKAFLGKNLAVFNLTLKNDIKWEFAWEFVDSGITCNKTCGALVWIDAIFITPIATDEIRICAAKWSIEQIHNIVISITNLIFR